MKKEDITLLAQLINSMRDASEELEEARKNKDLEKFRETKKEILHFQKEIDKLL